MNIVNKLTIRHLRKNYSRTLITIFAIILSVAMITAVAGFTDSMRDMLRRTYIFNNGDWHVTIFDVTEQQAADIADNPQVESSYTKHGEGNQRSVCFRLAKPTRDYEQTANEIAAKSGIQSARFKYHKELLAAEGVVTDGVSLNVIWAVSLILTLLIMGGSFVVIANAFYISASERIRQFGLLRSAGATKEQIRASVITEGLVLSLVGIPLGICIGFFVELIAIIVANHLFTSNEIGDGIIRFEMMFSAFSIVISGVLSFVTVLLSVWFPAIKSSKISVIDGIRLSNEIKISSKDVKTSPIIHKLFGFEGVIAQKALKRDRRKYRAAVVSLVVSIVLFIAGSGLGQQIEKAAAFYYPDYDINACVLLIGEYTEEYRIAADKLLVIDGADTERSYTYTAHSGDIPQFINDKAKETYFSLSNDEVMLNIHSITDAGFAKLCDELSVAPDVGAILINKAYLSSEGKKTEWKPFLFSKGMVVRFGENNEHSITINAQAHSIPRGIIGMFRSYDMNVVVPESAQYFKDDESAVGWMVTNAENPKDFCEEAKEIVSKLNDPEAVYDVIDIEEMTRTNKNVSLLITIFIMGFVGLLSLIAVTSVVATISAGVALRAREFAMLSSVGMTPKGIKDMLNLESLFYGLKALCIGLPLGLLCSYLVYRVISGSLEYPYIWPWKSMGISIAAVMLLTFGTMGYSQNKLKKMSIVETIRSETI